MTSGRLGIYGGTFNPIHTGHLIIAQEIYEQCSLDKLLFMPSARPPHKQNDYIVSPEHRYRMAELAIGNDRRFEVSDLEIQRPGLSYTIETLRALRDLYDPAVAIFFIIGADSLLEIDTWRAPDQVFELATVAVVPRPDVDLAQANAKWRNLSMIIDAPEIEISSTDIRKRAADGRSIRYLTPRSVAAYIEEHGLYKKEGKRQ